jgi:hypothetical protein
MNQSMNSWIRAKGGRDILAPPPVAPVRFPGADAGAGTGQQVRQPVSPNKIRNNWIRGLEEDIPGLPHSVRSLSI